MIVAGIDGSSTSFEINEGEIFLYTAVGVIATYENDEIKKMDFFPPVRKINEAKLTGDVVKRFLEKTRMRHEEEYKLALEVAEKYAPDILFLDGSLSLSYSNCREILNLLKDKTKVVGFIKHFERPSISLKDKEHFIERKGEIQTVYMKVGKEMIKFETTDISQEFLSTVYWLCSYNKAFPVPSVLLLADYMARIREREKWMRAGIYAMRNKLVIRRVRL